MALGEQLSSPSTVWLYGLNSSGSDSSGNSRTLTSVNVSFVPWRIGSGCGSYNWSAYSDSSDSAFNATGNFTVSCVFKANAKTNWCAMVSNIVTDANNYGQLYDIGIGWGWNNVVANTWSSSGWFLQLTWPAFDTGKWYYAAFVKAADNDWKLHVFDFDTGAYSVTSSSSSRPLSTTRKAGFRVGANAGTWGWSTPSVYFNGYVDEARFETVAVTYSELSKRFSNFKGLYAVL